MRVSLQAEHITLTVLKAASHKFYFFRSLLPGNPYENVCTVKAVF